MRIPLGGNRAALIDDADFEAISLYTWSFDGRYPATHNGKRPTLRKIRMHEFLLGKAPDGLEWDHENRDSMDNRRFNLRAVPHRKNIQNSRIQCGTKRPNTSGVKGVSWDKRRGAWRAYVSTDGRQHYVGRFAALEEAAAARRAAEERVWGATDCAAVILGK